MIVIEADYINPKQKGDPLDAPGCDFEVVSLYHNKSELTKEG